MPSEAQQSASQLEHLLHRKISTNTKHIKLKTDLIPSHVIISNKM